MIMELVTLSDPIVYIEPNGIPKLSSVWVGQLQAHRTRFLTDDTTLVTFEISGSVQPNGDYVKLDPQPVWLAPASILSLVPYEPSVLVKP